MMIPLSVFISFAMATLLLNLTPGPDMIFVSTRSIQHGVKYGIRSALGIAVGYLAHVTAAVLGISVILAKSALAFNIIKYLGTGYLLYLGLKSLLNKNTNHPSNIKEAARTNKRKIFFQGVITSIFNPKVAIFFLSFLPQFINAGASNPALQILFLGVYFIISATLVNVLAAILTGKTGALLTDNKFLSIQERISGMVFIFLGLRLAMEKHK